MTDAVVGGDAEQGEEADPDRHAQVDRVDLEQVAHVGTPNTREVQEPGLAVEPDHQEAAGPGDEDAGEDQQRRGDGA